MNEITSSGGKTRLGGISKRGDAYLRMLLVLGARSVLQNAGRYTDRLSPLGFRGLWDCMV
jgi:transposase